MAWDTDIRLRPGGATPADQQVYESDVRPVVLNEIILRSDEVTPNDIVVSDPTEISGTGRTGTGSVTQAAETCSGTGDVSSVAITGTGSFTQSAQSASGTATEEFSGSGAVTQAAETSSGSGDEIFSGSGSVTQAAETASGTGDNVNAFTGTGACSHAAQVADGTGVQFVVSGSGACTQASETIAGAGYQEFSGAGSVTQAAELCSGTGFTGAIITGTGDCTQAAQTCEGDDVVRRGTWGDGPRPRKIKLKGPKWQEVYKQYAKGELHSGRVDGPVVVKAKQARAIAYSIEKKTLKPVLDDDEQDNPFNKQR